MARARSNPSHNVASLKRALAEKEALLAEKEALLIERDRVIAVRDAELLPRRFRSNISRRSLRCCDGRGSAAPPRSSTARSSSWNSSLGSLKRGWRRQRDAGRTQGETGGSRIPVAAPDSHMAAAALVSFEAASLSGEQPFELLRVHEYRLLHRNVEVHINVERSPPCRTRVEKSTHGWTRLDRAKRR
jgi:hypothetical protein